MSWSGIYQNARLWTELRFFLLFNTVFFFVWSREQVNPKAPYPGSDSETCPVISSPLILSLLCSLVFSPSGNSSFSHLLDFYCICLRWTCWADLFHSCYVMKLCFHHNLCIFKHGPSVKHNVLSTPLIIFFNRCSLKPWGCLCQHIFHVEYSPQLIENKFPPVRVHAYRHSVTPSLLSVSQTRGSAVLRLPWIRRMEQSPREEKTNFPVGLLLMKFLRFICTRKKVGQEKEGMFYGSLQHPPWTAPPSLCYLAAW